MQRAAARLIRSGDSVFDIGANVGFHTLLFSRLVGPRGRVTAFEPLDRNLEYLSRHLQLNAAENVAVIPVALSDEPGRGFMDARGNPSMARLADDGRAVLVESLDHLIAANRVPIPQLLKIDVEGAESRVLRGASKTLVEHRPRIILAAHGWRQNDECRDTLLAHGYSIEEIRDGREDGNYELLAA
ncbi:MAG TPA: FkbM family methyltransferase [Thermoanaerobaculia bacterium]|nr:FkbM family methyltransferase [Thermoanaerobaculia bacterium]